jgi:hypothetical protein
MNLTTTRAKVKKSERTVLGLSLLVVVGTLLVSWQQQGFHSAFLIGYAAGIAGFFLLSITFSYLDRLPDWFRIIAVLSSGGKVLFLLLLALLLKFLGFSIVEVVLGLFLSQLVIMLSLLIIVYSDRKSVEVSNRNDKKDACS